MAEPTEIKNMEDLFNIGKSIGRSKFGEVYAAQRKTDLQEVALKVIDNHLWGKGDNSEIKDCELSSQEVKSWEIVNGSRYFPKFYGAYVTDSKSYIALERINGKTLADSIPDRVRDGKGYSPEEARAIIIEVAKGLKVIHSLGYLHRDISSTNVMLNENGEVKILDIGGMKESDEREMHSTCIHTPGYSALETLLGTYSVQSDIYALGALWAELVSGTHPRKLYSFEHELEYTLRDSSDDALFHRMVATDCKQRPQTIDEVIRTLLGTITFTTSDLHIVRNDWNIPNEEAVDYTSRIMNNLDLRDVERTRLLEDYLKKEPVNERDREVLCGALSMLRRGEKTKDICAYLEQFNAQNPELIFGYNRDQIKSLYSILIERENQIAQITGNNQFTAFLKLVQGTDISLIKNQLEEMVNLLGKYSTFSNKTIDNHKLNHYLQNLDQYSDRIKELQKTHRAALSDPGLQAAYLLLEDEGFDSFEIEKIKKGKYTYLLSAGLGVAAAATGYCFGADWFTMIGAAVGLGNLPVVSKALPSYKPAEVQFKVNHYDGSKISYNIRQALLTIPPDKYSQVLSNIKQIGEETDRSLSPIVLLQRVQEEL